MNKKQLTLGDLRKVRGAAVAGKKKQSSENVTGTVKRVCDCTSESPAAAAPAEVG
ncbi:MAG: hypothetical protein AAF799_03105 [Myxococcota bacterium]